ncbi:MAG: acyl-CoA thioesterase [Rhabdochlamydiaceae bacterium]|nr:acyl-CoA thioesterase [Rhabdochlamydiaceae bacterium]
MFKHTRSVYLKETDATGVIYFTSLFQYALEAFESYLHSKNFSLSEVFDKGYLMPIVHAEADYKAPLRVGNLIAIHLAISHVGVKSFSMSSQIELTSTKQIAGSVKIVHAFVRQGEKESCPIPSDLLQFLQ